MTQKKKQDLVPRCPICSTPVTNITENRMNTTRGCIILNNSGKCETCALRLVEVNGEWKTSIIDAHSLDLEIDLDLALEIYEVHAYNNVVIAKMYNCTLTESNKMADDDWKKFRNTLKQGDKIYTFKDDLSHGLAIVRKGFVVHHCDFTR